MAGYGYNDITSLVTGGGTITFGAGGYVIDPARCSGLIGTGEIRNPVDDKGQTSGFILHPFFEKGARGVLGGYLDASSISARNTLQDNLKIALRSILSTTGTLNFAGGAATLAVKFELGVEFPAISAHVKAFQFGLVSASTF